MFLILFYRWKLQQIKMWQIKFLKDWGVAHQLLPSWSSLFCQLHKSMTVCHIISVVTSNNLIFSHKIISLISGGTFKTTTYKWNSSNETKSLQSPIFSCKFFITTFQSFIITTHYTLWTSPIKSYTELLSPIYSGHVSTTSPASLHFSNFPTTTSIHPKYLFSSESHQNLTPGNERLAQFSISTTPPSFQEEL